MVHTASCVLEHGVLVATTQYLSVGENGQDNSVLRLVADEHDVHGLHAVAPELFEYIPAGHSRQ
jgi:hypothetical protein